MFMDTHTYIAFPFHVCLLASICQNETAPNTGGLQLLNHYLQTHMCKYGWKQLQTMHASPGRMLLFLKLFFCARV